jgi:hypothetical protein
VLATNKMRTGSKGSCILFQEYYAAKLVKAHTEPHGPMSNNIQCNSVFWSRNDSVTQT